MERQQGLKAMLNYPQVEPHHPILNSYPLDLTLIQKYQQLDHPLMKAVKEDNKFKYISLYGNQLVVYQLLRSRKQYNVIPQQLQYPLVR